MSESEGPPGTSGESGWLRAPAGEAQVEVRLPETAPENVKQAVNKLIAALQHEGGGIQPSQRCSYIKVEVCDVYVICRIVD